MASRGEVLRALQDDHRHLESLAARQNATEAALSHVNADSGKIWLCMGDSFIRLPSERAADVLRQDQARTTKIREGIESDIRDRSAHLASTSDVTDAAVVPSMPSFKAPPLARGTSGTSTAISSAPIARPLVMDSTSSPSSRPAHDTAPALAHACAPRLTRDRYRLSHHTSSQSRKLTDSQESIIIIIHVSIIYTRSTY